MAIKLDAILAIAGNVSPSLNNSINELEDELNDVDTELDDIDDGAKKASGGLSGLAGNKKLIAGLGVALAAVGGALGGIFAITKGAAERFGEAEEASRKYGISVEEVQRISNAGISLGFSGQETLDAVAGSIIEVNKRLGELDSKGTGPLADLGNYDLSGIRNAATDTERAAETFKILEQAAANGEAELAFVADKLAGSQGNVLASMIAAAGGADEFASAIENADHLSEESNANLAELAKNSGIVGNQFTMLKNRIGAAIAPLFNFLGALSPIIEGLGKFIEDNPKVAQGIGITLVAAFVTLGAVLAAAVLPPVLAFVAAGFATLVAWAPFIALGAAIVAVIAAIGAGIYLLIKNWDTVTDFFIDKFNVVKEFFMKIPDFFKGIFDSIRNSFVDAINWMLDKLNGFIDNINKVIEGFNKYVNPFGDVPTIPNVGKISINSETLESENREPPIQVDRAIREEVDRANGNVINEDNSVTNENIINEDNSVSEEINNNNTTNNITNDNRRNVSVGNISIENNIEGSGLTAEEINDRIGEEVANRIAASILV